MIYWIVGQGDWLDMLAASDDVWSEVAFLGRCSESRNRRLKSTTSSSCGALCSLRCVSHGHSVRSARSIHVQRNVRFIGFPVGEGIGRNMAPIVWLGCSRSGRSLWYHRHKVRHIFRFSRTRIHVNE